MATAMELIERPIVTSTSRTWRIDPEASHASFTVRNRFAFINHQVITGQFNDVSGVVMLDERHPTNSRVTLEVGVVGVSTGKQRRDKHLLAPEFFAADQHPTMSFVSESIESIDTAAGRFLVAGTLTIRGIQRATSFEVQFIRNETLGRPSSANFVASAALDRRDFGMTWSNPMIRIAHDVQITVVVEAVSDPVTRR